MTKVAFILAAALAAAAPAGAVIYVDQNACGYGDNGTSWSDAFHSIQMAIDFAAAGADKEIWVADGVYVASGRTCMRLDPASGRTIAEIPLPSDGQDSQQTFGPIRILKDALIAGIDPITVGEIQSIIAQLTSRGIGILITDHNVRETLDITDRAYIMVDGEILASGEPSELVRDPAVRQLYLGERFELPVGERAEGLNDLHRVNDQCPSS